MAEQFADERPRLILLPGLGADTRLLEGQRSLPARVEILAWIDPLPGESLAAYGLRMSGQINSTEPFFLGGISFGGMVALEIARHLKPRAVFLIASATSAAGVRRSLRIASPIACSTPAGLMGIGRCVPGVARHLFGARKREEVALFHAMLSGTSNQFLQWAAGATAKWPGVNDLGVPVKHVHGSCDRIIPVGNVNPDSVINGAGHLVNLTHATEVNALITRWMKESSARC